MVKLLRDISIINIGSCIPMVTTKCNTPQNIKIKASYNFWHKRANKTDKRRGTGTWEKILTIINVVHPICEKKMYWAASLHCCNFLFKIRDSTNNYSTKDNKYSEYNVGGSNHFLLYANSIVYILLTADCFRILNLFLAPWASNKYLAWLLGQ